MAKRKNIWPFGKGQPLGERTTYRRTRTVTPSRKAAAPRASKAITERESKRSESERLAAKLSDADLKAKLQRHYAKGGTLNEYLAANPAHAARIRKIEADSQKSRNAAQPETAKAEKLNLERRRLYGELEGRDKTTDWARSRVKRIHAIDAAIQKLSYSIAHANPPETLTRAAMNKLAHALSGQNRVATLDNGTSYTWSHDKQLWERLSGRRRANPWPDTKFAVRRRGAYPSTFNTLNEALDYQRERGGEVWSIGADSGYKWRKLKRNPADGAAEVFEEFHGTPSTELVTVKSRVHFHEHLAALGKLAYLKVAGVDGYEHTIKDFGGALLCSNEERNQLFIEGGDQTIDLGVFGIKSAHELESLGAVTEIGYRTTKHHLGAEGGKALYFHETGEEGGRAPDLVYRTRDERLEIVGGSYTIEAEGIKN